MYVSKEVTEGGREGGRKRRKEGGREGGRGALLMSTYIR